MLNINSSYFSYDASTCDTFADRFNRKPFLFYHLLHTHRLLGIPAIKKLAEKLATEKSPRGYFYLSKESRHLKWGSSAFQTAVSEAFEQIEESKMRLKLSYIHLEPEYGEILEACSRELSDLTSGDLVRDFRNPLATLFISSPNEVTPYHVDSEANFLVQLYGTKVVYVFDGKDPELVNWRMLEEYWGGGGVTLREEFRSRGLPFELRPGAGVHIPVHFPHWVQNGPSPSISLAMAFMPAQEPSDVLRINYHLRKWGMDPIPPGENQSLDAAKRAIVQGVRTVRRTLQGARGPQIKLR